jgi:hypothetical protein
MFSPDGSKIVYVSEEDGGGFYDIWIMNADGSNHQQLTFDNRHQFHPSFSPDGNIIVYVSYEDGGAYLDIWLMDTDGTNRQQLTFEDYDQENPCFSPDGTKIVYQSMEDGGNIWDLWITCINGIKHRQLTTDNHHQIEPFFNPVGNQITYTSREDGGLYYDIWVLNLSTLICPLKTVWINDTLPPEVKFITSSAETNRTGDYNWTFYNVEPGKHNFTITVEVNSSVLNGTILTNYVHLDSIDPQGNDMPDSSDYVNVTVLTVPIPSPPTLYINVSKDMENVILYWDPPSTPGIDHYLIYRSTSQIDFDFNTVWVNTSKNSESGETGPIPLRTNWNDTKAALPSNETNYEEQYYYTIRAVNVFGEMSGTSRTVGKWTKSFPQDVSTFSIPLEPLRTVNTTIDHYQNDMNAKYIKWMDHVDHIWMKHGDGGVNDTQLEVGKGYEVAFDSPTNYTFTGLPGAMIMYNDDSGYLGFNPASEAKNLTATVDPATGNVTLNWTQPLSIGFNDKYFVLRSIERDGLWKGDFLKIATLNFDVRSYNDVGNATSGTQYYYMIVPVNETGIEGSSTYSIGVWTREYQPQYDTFGIPLKLSVNQTVDWYCDNIPDTVGMNYFINSQQRWGWHSTRMSLGAFDPLLMMSEGYQISFSSATKFTFIGV